LGCGQPTPRPIWLSILSTIDCLDMKNIKVDVLINRIFTLLAEPLNDCSY
jgi:hypothetical protein